MERYKLSDAANLSFGTWNCSGLSRLKKDLISAKNLDLVCVTENHGWRDFDPLVVYSEVPQPRDKFAGVSLHLKMSVAKYIMSSGQIGSRIVYCRLRGVSCNITVVGVYIPQKNRKNPDQKCIYDKLETLLQAISKQRDCIILMGDFNSRLKRNITGFTGRWSIHNVSDEGGDRLLEIMHKFGLVCSSTYFQPKRRHSNATFMNIQPDKPPSQIDHIFVSRRWASSVRSCAVKWGLPIQAYGRKYDHALVEMKFKLRLKCSRSSKRRNFKALTDAEVATAHNTRFNDALQSSGPPANTSEKWKRLCNSLSAAQEAIPFAQRQSARKWETSEATLTLVKERREKWASLTADERKTINKQVSRSARNDYRSYIQNILSDIDRENQSGNMREVYRLTKQLSNKKRANMFIQPTVDLQGNRITNNEQQLNAWADFLENKFSSRADEPEVDMPDDQIDTPAIELDEVVACVTKLRSNKAAGPDCIPVEQYKASEDAVIELHSLLSDIFETEEIPDDFVLADMLMTYKKKQQDDRSNYRALGLLNHGYKVFARLLLLRMMPYIAPKISDMQAGFRKERGCRDNILMLVTIINHLLSQAQDDVKSLGVITYIDFTAAFDSILHSYLFNALKEYGVPAKYCRLVKAVYKSATVRVRIVQQGGQRSYSRNISIDRGVIQGDIPSPICFLVAVDKLLKEHGCLDLGIKLTDEVLFSDAEFADDVFLPTEDVPTASYRLSNLQTNADKEAGMQISIPKTKNQHIMPTPKVSQTTEADVAALPAEKQLRFECDKCGWTYANQHGLSIHQARFCKKRRTNRLQNRKGTVADRIVKRHKIEQLQETLDKVRIGADELENVYSFIYLGADTPADGNHEVPVQHRINIAWGAFNDHRKTLTAAKLPTALRTHLYRATVVSTMAYGSEAWMFTNKIKQKLNGVNSKLLAQITRRTIHEEARIPTFNTIEHVLSRRWDYLGHILRLDESRALKRIVINLAPEHPYQEGSLLADTSFRSIEEMKQAAQDRKNWREGRRRWSR